MIVDFGHVKHLARHFFIFLFFFCVPRASYKTQGRHRSMHDDECSFREDDKSRVEITEARKTLLSEAGRGYFKACAKSCVAP